MKYLLVADMKIDLNSLVDMTKRHPRGGKLATDGQDDHFMALR
jgi:hypothetical protein